MYSTACQADDITVKSWRDTWISNVKKNHALLGSFKEHSVGKLWGLCRDKGPAIIAGSGPSLKHNGAMLKDRGDIPLISCLHNFHFFEDNGVEVDYYVSLDAGPVVLEEISEGGQHDEAYYWEKTKDRTLVAFIGSDPRLLEKWQGKIFVYNAPVPDNAYKEEIDKVELFHTYISNGGNVLGACLYLAKGIMGANPIAFVGADFSFSYDKKFHGWDSKYDKDIGHVLRTNDIYGNKVFTWQSYYAFKNWFDFIALKVPGIYINCTEGGTFGAYPDGNIMAVKQMDLQDFIDMQHMCDKIKEQCLEPEKLQNLVLF